MNDLYKFGRVYGELQDSPSDEHYEYPNAWAREKTSGPDRLVIAPRSGYTELLVKLANCLLEPFDLLYVLVVRRGQHEEGRYQSDYSFSAVQLREFLRKYSDFFEKDGRHNLWIRSTSGEGLLVYDRHNVIYAYGPLDQFTLSLVSSGLAESKDVHFHSAHAHHYHANFDADENRLLTEEEWTISPLRPGDENAD
jgi:hypothetical protein